MRKLIAGSLTVALIVLGMVGMAVTTDLTQAATSVFKDDDCDSSGKGSGDCPDDSDRRDNDDDEIDEDVIAASTALAAPQGEFEIRIIDEEFFPSSLTVEVGQPVAVVNADDDEHTATSTVFDTGNSKRENRQPSQSMRLEPSRLSASSMLPCGPS